MCAHLWHAHVRVCTFAYEQAPERFVTAREEPEATAASLANEQVGAKAKKEEPVAVAKSKGGERGFDLEAYQAKAKEDMEAKVRAGEEAKAGTTAKTESNEAGSSTATAESCSGENEAAPTVASTSAGTVKCAPGHAASTGFGWTLALTVAFVGVYLTTRIVV